MTDECMHRWVLPQITNMPTVLGECNLCGATRDFSSTIEKRPPSGGMRNAPAVAPPVLVAEPILVPDEVAS